MKIKNYYAIICDCSEGDHDDQLICGIYASKKEAQDVANEIKDCPAPHYIKKCDAIVTIKK